LAGDLESARRLVATSLGRLAGDSEQAERLRHTVQVFLAEKGSYLATAERLHLHKNTVKYRVDKAMEGRGRPVAEDRFDLELALMACDRLGPAVLGPPGE
jgi:DNA-binding PucR family transcriptional regulator